MDLEKAFRSQNVVVRKKGEAGAIGEACFVHSVTGPKLTLVTAEDRLNSEPPEKGDAIVIQSNRMEATYSVDARVTACEHQTDDTGEHALRIHARQSGGVLRIQRRDNFRVRMQMRVEIKAPRNGIVGPIALMTDDISAGGLCVISPKRLNTGTVVSITLHLPDNKPLVACGGKVVRCAPVKDGAYELSIVLQRVRPSDEDRIVHTLTRAIRDTIRAIREQE